MKHARTANQLAAPPRRAEPEFALPPLLSTRALVVGWYMASRLAVRVLVPGAVLLLLLLSPVGVTAFVSPTLILFYCAAGVIVAGCLATDYFAGQWAKREFGWTPPGHVWWGVFWRTGLVFAALSALGWGLLAAYPFMDSLTWALLGLAALLVCFGTTLALGWSTMYLILRQLNAAMGDWEEDAAKWADEVWGTAARSTRTTPNQRRTTTSPRRADSLGDPSTPRPPTAPKASSQKPEVVVPAPRPKASPLRPVPAQGGTVRTRFWQNVVGGWEFEISYAPENPNGPETRGRILYRTERKPRPFGAPYGGFYSRAQAEEFAKTQIEQGLEFLDLAEALRRTSRYVIPGGLPAVLNPVGGGAKVHDLSLGGACAEHDKPLAPGQEIRLAVNLPGGRLDAPAKVVWSVPAGEPAHRGDAPLRFRSGFQFLAPLPQSLSFLETFLATA